MNCSASLLVLCCLTGLLSVIEINGNTACPDLWIRYGSACYFFGFDQHLPFESAQHFCLQHGSNLVDITGGHEWSFIRNLLKHFHPSPWWTGLNDQQTEGDFIWISSEQTVSFSDWANGHPSSPINGTKDGDCVYVSPRDDFMWIDVDCTAFFQPICKKLASSDNQAVG